MISRHFFHLKKNCSPRFLLQIKMIETISQIAQKKEKEKALNCDETKNQLIQKLQQLGQKILPLNALKKLRERGEDSLDAKRWLLTHDA